MIILGLLALGGGGYYLWQRGSAPSAPGETATPQEEAGVVDSIKEALSTGESYKCTWNGPQGSTTSFVKGESMYAEITTQDETAYMIFKDNCIWSWATEGDQGFKFCSEGTTENIFEGSDEVSYGTTTLPTGVKYSCSRASVSDSQFSPPSSVNFSSFDDLVPEGN